MRYSCKIIGLFFSALLGVLQSTNAQFSSSLPIIRITTPSDQDIMDDPRITAHMGIVYNGEGRSNYSLGTFNDYDGLIAIEYRGTSSLSFDKKGYGFETRKEDGSNNNVSLIGMPRENDWVLHGPYSDKSLLRNVLSYHLGALTGRYAPRTRLCELFVDDAYEGIYMLTEKIKQDNNRVDISNLREEDNDGDELTGGYIIKVDRNVDDTPGLGWTSSFPDFKFFAYVDPQSDQITDQQADYIQDHMYDFESALDAQDYEDRYLDYIDVESFVDYFLVTEIGKHIDAYKLSFYMYKEKDSKGGKLNFGPLWDFNLGYGNFDFACPPDPAGWAYEFPDCGSWHPFWARKIADIPNVQHLTDCRWQELRAGPFRTDSLLLFIDQKEREMGLAIARNFERWPVLGEYLWPNAFVGNTYGEELDFLKNWLEQRLTWLDANMVGDCGQYITAVDDSDLALLSIYPNPSQGLLQLDWPSAEASVLSIYNPNNKLVKTQDVTKQGLVQVNIEHLPSGVYTLIVRSSDDQSMLYSERLIILP